MQQDGTVTPAHPGPPVAARNGEPGMLRRDGPGQWRRGGPRRHCRHGADQGGADLAAVLGIAKECAQRCHNLLERAWVEAPGLVLNEADDVGGTHRAEVDAVVAEAMDEKVACDRPVVAARGSGQASISSQMKASPYTSLPSASW